MKKTILFILVVTQCVLLQGQAQSGYYDAAEGNSEAALKTALYNIIKVSKDKGYAFLYTIYETSDNIGANKVWDMYSTCEWTHNNKKCGNYSKVCDCYNREHSIPQSWFGSKTPMVSDAYHVYPTDGKVNGQRSNDPFGECENGTVLDQYVLGRSGNSTFPGYSGRVFEPVDEYKGDFARTYFYFATRYQNIMTTMGGNSFNKTTYPSLSDWSIRLFLKWHNQDPVSQKEIDRNNAVEVYQLNRNPFVDYPELADFIWGSRKGEPWNLKSGVSEITIDFAIMQHPVKDEIVFKTNESGLSYTIYSINGQMLKSGTISGQEAIQIAELQSGVYIIHLQSGTKQIVKKFIVNK